MTQFWLWFDAVCMALGGFAILAIGKRRTPAEEGESLIHGIIPIIAALSYFAMAVGQGVLLLPSAAHTVAVPISPDAEAIVPTLTRIFYYARYIDWAFTTPLLLLTLAMTAMHSGPRRTSLVAGLLLSDLMMIVTALFFGLSTIPALKWTWFLISCAAFVPVYWIIWGPLMEENRRERADVQEQYRKSARFLSAAWFLYPVVLFFSTDGTGLFNTGVSVMLIAILDLVSKVVYGLICVSGTARLVDRDGVNTAAV